MFISPIVWFFHIWTFDFQCANTSESYSTNHFGNPKMMYKLKHFYANAFVAELYSVRVKRGLKLF
jgi:hypothetical protein